MNPVYDQIGEGYTKHRCADRRIVAQLADVLCIAPPAAIADIGAGTGLVGLLAVGLFVVAAVAYCCYCCC